MRLLRNVLAAAMLLFGLGATPAFAGFLQFPLHCSTPLVSGACPGTSIDYTTHGAYTLDAMNSILDHSMAINPANSYYPYGTTVSSSTGGDLFIRAFNGEYASGPKLSTDWRCIGGTINLKPDWSGTGTRMTNNTCGSTYSSYDEHPGYDYKASTGTPVYAAASGTVISTICYLGNTGSGTCASWGALAIRPTVATGGNNYFYQYLHMDTMISVVAGQSITAGQYLGTVGGRCGTGCSLPAHLHFEVRYIPTPVGPEAYPIVDPYGWVGGGTDPLYSSSVVAPANLWQ